MSARVRTVILLAIWWLGGASLAAAQVPEHGRADSPRGGAPPTDRPDRFAGVGPLPRYRRVWRFPRPAGTPAPTVFWPSRPSSIAGCARSATSGARPRRPRPAPAPRPIPPTSSPRFALPRPGRRAAPPRRRRHTGRYQCRPAPRPRAAGAAQRLRPQPRDQRHRRHPPGRPRGPSARQRRGAGVRGGAAVRPRSLLHHQDLPQLRERGGGRRGGLPLLDRPARAGSGWTSGSSASSSATSTAGTCTRCPRPSTRWSTSASSAPRD